MHDASLCKPLSIKYLLKKYCVKAIILTSKAKHMVNLLTFGEVFCQHFQKIHHPYRASVSIFIRPLQVLDVLTTSLLPELCLSSRSYVCCSPKINNENEDKKRMSLHSPNTG